MATVIIHVDLNLICIQLWIYCGRRKIVCECYNSFNRVRVPFWFWNLSFKKQNFL